MGTVSLQLSDRCPTCGAAAAALVPASADGGRLERYMAVRCSQCGTEYARKFDSVRELGRTLDEREFLKGVRFGPNSPLVRALLDGIQEAEERELARRTALARRTWWQRLRDAWRAAVAAWRGK